MENRLLNQFINVISFQWQSEEINEPYDLLKYRELFELTYHTFNNICTRCIWINLNQDFMGGSKAIMYSKNKTFTSIQSSDDYLNITKFFNERVEKNWYCGINLGRICTR